jgi:hypothetical protein
MNSDPFMKRIYLDHVDTLTYEQREEKRKRVEADRTKFFVNRLPADVFIRERSGLLTRVRPRQESTAYELDYLFICEHIECTPDTQQDYIRQARSTPNSMREYAQRALLTDWSGNPPLTARYSVDVKSGLSLAQLQENDCVVYLEEHDVVVMYGLSESDMNRIHHPYSKAGHTQASYRTVTADNPYLKRGDFTLNIRIVDNNDEFGSKWILMDDTPFCIVACQDPDVADGIYVTYSKNLLNGQGPKQLLSDRYSFGDKKLPYKLYASQQEALQHRGSIQIQELETKARAAENSLLKVQQERDNMERDAELRLSRHSQELEKLQREREKLLKEHELYLEKQAAEIMSVRRKNTIEVIKCVPVVLSAIAATVAALKK